jgi:hypothetical protein
MMILSYRKYFCISHRPPHAPTPRQSNFFFMNFNLIKCNSFISGFKSNFNRCIKSSSFSLVKCNSKSIHRHRHHHGLYSNQINFPKNLNSRLFSNSTSNDNKQFLIEQSKQQNDLNKQPIETIVFVDSNSKNIQFEKSISNNNSNDNSNDDNENNVKPTNFVRHWLTKLYLPEHYPSSVGPNFASYSGWLMLQNTVGSAAYVLSTSALLTSIGIGTTTALPLAATVNWVLKDGLGSLGMIGYAAYYGQRFDRDAKTTKWRADALFNVGVLLELLTPLVPGLFLPLASLANVAKGIGGLAAGASKAALHQTLARRDNLGDVTAKLYSQGITAYLLGMLLGIQTTFAIASPLTSGTFVNAWSAFALLTATHLYASHRALSLLHIPVLTQHRLSLLTQLFIDNDRIATIGELTANESILFAKQQQFGIQLAPSIQKSNVIIFV